MTARGARWRRNKCRHGSGSGPIRDSLGSLMWRAVSLCGRYVIWGKLHLQFRHSPPALLSTLSSSPAVLLRFPPPAPSCTPQLLRWNLSADRKNTRRAPGEPSGPCSDSLQYFSSHTRPFEAHICLGGTRRRQSCLIDQKEPRSCIYCLEPHERISPPFRPVIRASALRMLYILPSRRARASCGEPRHFARENKVLPAKHRQ